MPTAPLSDELAREAVKAWLDHECYQSKAARSLGLRRETFRSRLNIGKARGFHLSDGAMSVVRQAKLAPVEAKGGWIHNYDSEGKKTGTTRWATPTETVTVEELTETLTTAFDNLPRAVPLPAPEHVMDAALCTLYPLFDVHLGMHAWGQETGGEDYDLKLAVGDLRNAFGKVTNLMPHSQQAVLLIGGDFFHADDNRSETPGNRHRLDTDGRFLKVVLAGVTIMTEVATRLAQKHEKVLIRVMRGNHDEHSHIPLMLALWTHFQNHPQIEVELNPRDLFMFQWGNVAIFAQHGDKGSPTEFVLKLGDTCSFFSECHHRFAFTGHRHKMSSQRIGGVRWEQLDAFCPPDTYGSTWAGRREISAVTFHVKDGLILRAFDPVDRNSQTVI